MVQNVYVKILNMKTILLNNVCHALVNKNVKTVQIQQIVLNVMLKTIGIQFQLIINVYVKIHIFYTTTHAINVPLMVACNVKVYKHVRCVRQSKSLIWSL